LIIAVVVIVVVVVILAAVAFFFLLDNGMNGIGQYTEEVDEQYTASPGLKLEVLNVNGDIDIITYNGDQILLDGVKRADRAQDLDLMELVVTQSGDEIELKVEHTEDISNLHGDSFDLSLRVPDNIVLEKVKSVNGDVHIQSTEEVVEVETTNGAIRVDMRTINSNLNIDTTNGPVDVYVNPDLDLTFDISTVNGGITISGVVVNLSDDAPDYKRGDMGSGGYEIFVDTVNGNVRVHAL
jgi:DUF4097 and DUF4098 domain-containing protein YvlB